MKAREIIDYLYEAHPSLRDELMAALAERDDRIAFLEQCAGLARYDVNYVLTGERLTTH